MDDDLRKLPASIRLSHRSAVIFTENIGLAPAFKALFFGLAIGSQATLLMGILAYWGRAFSSSQTACGFWSKSALYLHQGPGRPA